MEVIETSLSEEEMANRDYDRDVLKLNINGKQVFRVMDGEPEDATLSRDFNDCWKIVELLALAHKAGLNKEPFKIERVKTTIDDI